MASEKFKGIFSDVKYFVFDDDDIIHLAQCQYIIEYLKSKNIKKIYYLSDYLNKDFLEQNLDNDFNERKDVVVYNPRKGFEFTEKLIKLGSYLEWKPIINMKPNEVINLLKNQRFM